MKNSGVTLLEIIIVMSILAILATMATGYYRNYLKSVELQNAAKNIIFDLKGVQVKAMSGENQLKWGVHFVNSSSDYYETFSTPTNYADPSKVVENTIYLPSTVIFTNPSEGNTADIIFERIKGTISSLATITISSENNSQTITVTVQGNVY